MTSVLEDSWHESDASGDLAIPPGKLGSIFVAFRSVGHDCSVTMIFAIG
jgi:hypothetical protein